MVTGIAGLLLEPCKLGETEIPNPNAKHLYFDFGLFFLQVPVVRRPISLNPGINFNPGLFFYFASTFFDNFLNSF